MAKVHLRSSDHPAVTELLKRSHAHSVATLHLVESRREDVIQVAAAVDMLVHVDVIRPYLKLGFNLRTDPASRHGTFSGIHRGNLPASAQRSKPNPAIR